MIAKQRLTVVAACALAALASGCRSSGGDLRLQDLPLLPYTRVPTELLADVGAPGSDAQGWQRTLVNGTPSWEGFEGNTLLPGRLDQVHVDVTHLSLPLLVGLPWLPLWTRIERRSWPRGRDGQLAPRNQIVTLTPFTSDLMEWDLEDRDDDYPRLDVSGLPPLYRRVNLAGGDGQTSFDVVTTLWSLGPWWSAFDVRETGYELSVLQAVTLFGPQVAEEPGVSGWIVEPFGLAGLGHWLWSSRAWSGPGDDEGWRHGPLGGWLGWAHKRWTTDILMINSGQVRQRHDGYDLLLGGALWASFRGEQSDTWNGPLWGMFGWGTTRDRSPCLRLLWLPIPL